MRPVRQREFIETVFEEIDTDLSTELVVYLMGGGAMTFRGFKDATKDLDLLVDSNETFRIFRDLLYDRGYTKDDTISEEYKSLGATLVLDKPESCRFDVFDRQVVGKLQLTERMKTRTDLIYEGDHLTAYALSNEDIFLFKGVAGRTADPEDMLQILQAVPEFNYETVLSEFEAQLPMNHGDMEAILLKKGRIHPVILFERSLSQLPGVPDDVHTIVEEYADHVYVEHEVVKRTDEGDNETIENLVATLTARSDVVADSTDDIEAAIERLVEKNVVEQRDGRLILIADPSGD